MPNKQQLHKNSFPLKSDNIQNLTSYLQIHRKIPSEVINLLIQENLLYQSYDSLYAVFINRKNNYAELQPIGQSRSTRQSISSESTGFWCFNGCFNKQLRCKKAFICSSSIDAISLFLIHKELKIDTNAYYCSITQSTNQDAINQIKKYTTAILALEKGKNSIACRENNLDIEHIIPNTNNWSEDWHKQCPSNKTIYVLKLEDGCFYIGQSENYCLKERIQNHFRGKGSEWTRKHKPMEIIETYSDFGNYRDFEKLENQKTVEYMRNYGVANVRGGFFTTIDTNAVIKNLSHHGYTL